MLLFLVIEMEVDLPDETNGTCQDKETVEVTDADNLIDFLFGEETATRKKIQEKGTNGPINIHH